MNTQNVSSSSHHVLDPLAEYTHAVFQDDADREIPPFRLARVYMVDPYRFGAIWEYIARAMR